MVNLPAGLEETFEIEVDGTPVAVRVRDGTVDVTPGSAGEHASVKMVTDRQGFIDLARGHVADRVHIEGDADALARLQRVFSLTQA